MQGPTTADLSSPKGDFAEDEHSTSARGISELIWRCRVDQQGRCVFVANGEIQAQQIRAFLQAEGVASVFRGESLRKTHGLTLDGLGLVEILVAEPDEDSARTLLASAEAGDLRLDDDAPVESS
jgi:hypothetical protein